MKYEVSKGSLHLNVHFSQESLQNKLGRNNKLGINNPIKLGNESLTAVQQVFVTSFLKKKTVTKIEVCKRKIWFAQFLTNFQKRQNRETPKQKYAGVE